jgi:hypothetical protein
MNADTPNIRCSELRRESSGMVLQRRHFHSPRISRVAHGICLLGFVALCASGCVMRRTVKEGNEVVAQGYVVKAIP